MKNKFSTSWNSSKQARKQRKYRYNAPLHILRKFTGSHLSAELKKKYEMRSIAVRKGDKVKIMVGQFKGKTGKVEKVDVKNTKVFVSGIEVVKKDGTKTQFALNPSNLMITELNLNDKKRIKNDTK